MGVIDKSEDKAEVKDAAEEQQRLEAEFIKDIKEDVNADKKGDVEGAEQDTDKEKKDGVEQGDEEQKEDDASTEAEQEEEAEEQEETDPKQARINELIAEKRQLEARLRKLESKAAEKTPAMDPDRERLERMSVEELRLLKKEARLAWKETDDMGRSRQLMELEDKIDTVIAEAPQRFKNQQLEHFYEAVNATKEEFGEKMDDGLTKKIFDRANAIYSKYNSLQRDVEGQAIAWQQAAEFYRETSKLSATKEKALQLERENNKLKKKVVLDTAISKGAQKGNEEERLFKRAKSGDKSSELEFFKKTLNL